MEHNQITNVNVIDVINETIKYIHDVVIKNGIIDSIKPNSLPSDSPNNAEENQHTLNGVTAIDGRQFSMVLLLWSMRS